MTKYYLRNVVGKPFPKKCSCGKIFTCREEYIGSTSHQSGSSYEEIKGAVMELRNCTECSSQIMIEVEDLRDYTLDGVRQRQKHVLQATL